MAYRLGKSSAFGLLMGFIVAWCFINFEDFHPDDFNPHSEKLHETLFDTAKDSIPTLFEMRKVYDITDCVHKIPRKKIEQRGNYWVLLNYVQAKRKFQCFESVTYTTQGDYVNIDNLVTLVNRWRGPISVALYAPGDDFQNTLESIAYVRNCDSTLIKKYVTFHLFFPYSHSPIIEVGM